jgi:LytR cell envelope-related transcriptional attenuator
MTDFIDVLEQQLVAAHRGRGRRLFALPWRTTIVFAGAVAAAIAIVVAVLALSSPTPHRAASPPTQPPQTTPVTPPARVRIAVLNGTTVTGLARAAADELKSKGYDEPNVVTNDVSNQSRPRSLVYYAPGHKADAQGVAGCLNIGLDRVQPMGTEEYLQATRANRADVAVYVGADRVP